MASSISCCSIRTANAYHKVSFQLCSTIIPISKPWRGADWAECFGGLDGSDTYCINKVNLVELDEAIRSMFRWYEGAAKCYAYLSDVSVDGDIQQVIRPTRGDTF